MTHQRHSHAGRILWLAVLSAACTSPAPTPATPAAASSPVAPAASVLVPIVSRPLASSVHLQGELTPYRAVDLFARVAAYVKAVSVDVGSHVQPGAVLVQLVAPELAQQRTEADARLAVAVQSQTRLEAAAKTSGAVAPAELDAIHAGVSAERAHVAALRDLESYLTVRAPFDGVVASRTVQPGALVGPASGPAGMLLRLEDHARLRLTTTVPERFAGGTLLKRAVAFTVSAAPGQTFRGTIARVSGTVDPRTRGMAVEMDVPASAQLAPGMFADVLWPTARATASLLVPPSAVVQTATRTYVIRVRGGAADLVDVQRGMLDGELTEVFGAVSAADTVLRRGSDDVLAGARIAQR